MKLTSNIVLVGNQGRTLPYVVQLIPADYSNPRTAKFMFKRSDNLPGRKASLLKKVPEDQVVWTKVGNDWYESDKSGDELTMEQATIRLYFPQYSADTYSNNCTYMLSLFTYVHGYEVELGSFRIKRKDALACAPIRFGGMDEYYEYMDFTIADPFSVHYNNSCSNLRRALGEPPRTNNTGSTLYVSLHIVEEGEDGYIPDTKWECGQNNIMISDAEDLSVHLRYDNDDKKFNMKLTFNEAYEGDITEYITETYGCEYFSMIWDLVLMDKDDIYFEQSKVIRFDGEFDTKHFSEDFNVVEMNYSDEEGMEVHNIFSSWDNWKDGLYMVGSVSFFREAGDVKEKVPFMTIFSNRFIITQDVFALLTNHDNFKTSINLDKVDMDFINLTAINRIVQKTTVMSKTPDNAKNHMVQPIFYQTRDIGDVVIHPAVTEIIALNLDSYKTRVSRFLVQIEGVSFKEVGRTSKGVLFKIYGNSLPKSTESGTLYILNQDSELVTTGKYIYSR